MSDSFKEGLVNRYMKAIKIFAGFAVLFVLYHAAEYMIVFKNNPTGFLGFQIGFFIAAWLIGQIQTGKGLSAWGLDWRKGLWKHLTTGMAAGLLLYGFTFGLSLALGIERITNVPAFVRIAPPLGLFVFGNIFSSFSEDVLTRGYVYHHFQKHLRWSLLIVLSASLYLLNHIYRLQDGPRAWVYLFMLGILYVIPLLRTRRLWFTGGMHWAGNCFFYAMHELVKTEQIGGTLSPNYLLALCALLMIPFNNWILSIVKLEPPMTISDQAFQVHGPVLNYEKE